MDQDVKKYIDSKFNELNSKMDNLLELFEKMRSNEIRTLLYSQLTARQLNFFFHLDELRNKELYYAIPYYEQLIHNSSFKVAHPLTKKCSSDLTDLVIKKSKGRKDLIEDDFTKSLSFIAGIDESLL